MILDTNGLSAMASGDPTLEPLLRRAAEIAVPVIVLGSTVTAFAGRAIERDTNSGLPNLFVTAVCFEWMRLPRNDTLKSATS